MVDKKECSKTYHNVSKVLVVIIHETCTVDAFQKDINC